MVLDVATSTPAEAARFVRVEFERWARVIKEAGGTGAAVKMKAEGEKNPT
jgi:hypothetical protein